MMQEIPPIGEMTAFAAEAARRREVKAGNHPADLDEHEVGKRLDVLVVDRTAGRDAVDDDRIRRRGDRQVPERPGVALPVRMRDLVLEHAEDVQLVRVPDGVGGDGHEVKVRGEGERWNRTVHPLNHGRTTCGNRRVRGNGGR